MSLCHRDANGEPKNTDDVPTMNEMDKTPKQKLSMTAPLQ
jgi:hypothetical protein